MPQAVKFMEIAGFDFSGEFITVYYPSMALMHEALDAINKHVVELGGKIEVKTDFDPTKSHKMTTADSFKPASLTAGDEYDPTKLGEMIEKIKKEREAALEGKIKDKQIKVINCNLNNNAQSIKQLLFKIDQDEAERMKELNLTEEKLEVAQGHASAMRFLA